MREQLRALRAAGADVTLFCYGAGAGPAPQDIRLQRIPRALSPRQMRAGPSPRKPFADAALAGTLVSAQRRNPFDAAIAHNGEAALAALAARPVCGLPVVYVAHTLLGVELDAYAPAPLAGAARALGFALDRALAAHCDGVVALCREAAERLAEHARGPLARIPPGLDPAPPPSEAACREVCARLGVEPGHFALYSGNVDRYQDLDLLALAAARVPELPVLLATHGERRGPAPLRCHRTTPEEARALCFACSVAVLPRRRPGGFPMKLLGYMEAARPIVARANVADGLEHDRSAWLLGPDAGAAEFAEALRGLALDRPRAARLGRGARGVLEASHAWPELAQRTLSFVSAVITASRAGRERRSRSADARRAPRTRTSDP